jgi:2-iminobutanoate/2-iminopropanoate deaminase
MTEPLSANFALRTRFSCRLFLATILCTLGAAGCTASVTTNPAAAPAAVHAPSEGGLPFSPVVRVGPTLYLSGQIGTTSMSPPALVAGGIEAETRQTMENIKGVLAKNGASMDDIVKCTVMMADMREWAAMNVVYASYFPKHKPARSSFATAGLALGARVEIECLAYRP